MAEKITSKLESWNAKPSVTIKWNVISVLLNQWENWQCKLESNLCWKMVFKSKDGVYCKCNIHSSVSIEGGPAFSVNRPFFKSTHTRKRMTHSKLAIREIELMELLTILLKIRTIQCLEIRSLFHSSIKSILRLSPPFSSIAALYIMFQIPYNAWLCAQVVTKRF